MGVLLMVPALGLFEVGLTFARSASLHSPPPTPPPPSPPLPSLSHTAAPQAGLLRAKNSVSVLIQCFAGVAVLKRLLLHCWSCKRQRARPPRQGCGGGGGGWGRGAVGLFHTRYSLPLS